MKYLVWVLILGALGYLFYSAMVKPVSGEMGEVLGLEKAFNRATDRYIAAMRQAGEPGFAVIADPDQAERKVQDVRRRVADLLKTLDDPKAQARAGDLARRVEEFCRLNQIL